MDELEPNLNTAARPGRGLRVTGIVMIVIAMIMGAIVAGVAYWAFAGFDFEQFAMERTDVPGTIEFDADEPGNYFFHVEGGPGFDARTDLDIELRDRQTDETIELQPWMMAGEELDDIDDAEFRAFRIHDPGQYALHVSNEDDVQYPAMLGRIPTDDFGRMLAGGAVGFCGGGLAVLILVIGVILLIVGLLKA